MKEWTGWGGGIELTVDSLRLTCCRSLMIDSSLEGQVLQLGVTKMMHILEYVCGSLLLEL